MILTGKYNEVMGRLELSDEAKARILQTATEHAATGTPRQGKIIQFSSVRRYAALAACLAVVLLAVFALPRLRQGGNDPNDVASSGGILDCDTVEALSAAVGFPVEELSELPFAPEEVNYTDYFGEMAQITYKSGEASVTLRKARGNEDISGDFNDYSTIRELQAGNVTATLKGWDADCSLAFWQRNGFSYTLYFEPGIPEPEAERLTTAVIQRS